MNIFSNPAKAGDAVLNLYFESKGTNLFKKKIVTHKEYLDMSDIYYYRGDIKNVLILWGVEVGIKEIDIPEYSQGDTLLDLAARNIKTEDELQKISHFVIFSKSSALRVEKTLGEESYSICRLTPKHKSLITVAWGWHTS
jgi:hypothetical protein